MIFYFPISLLPGQCFFHFLSASKSARVVVVVLSHFSCELSLFLSACNVFFS